MNNDIGTTVTTTGLIAEIVVVGAGTDSSSFDCAKGRYTMCAFIMGSAIGDDITVTVEDSADDSTFAAVAGFDSLAVVALDKGSFSVLVDHTIVRRYVRVNIVLGGGSNTRVSGVAMTYHGVSGGANGADLVIA